MSAVAKRKPPAAGMGRPKGSLNKTTALLKDAILEAATLAGGKEGLVGYLRVQAEANPGPFMALLGKVLPIQINASVKHSAQRMSDDELASIASRGREGASEAEEHSGQLH